MVSGRGSDVIDLSTSSDGETARLAAREWTDFAVKRVNRRFGRIGKGRAYAWYQTWALRSSPYSKFEGYLDN